MASLRHIHGSCVAKVAGDGQSRQATSSGLSRQMMGQPLFVIRPLHSIQTREETGGRADGRPKDQVAFPLAAAVFNRRVPMGMAWVHFTFPYACPLGLPHRSHSIPLPVCLSSSLSLSLSLPCVCVYWMEIICFCRATELFFLLLLTRCLGPAKEWIKSGGGQIRQIGQASQQPTSFCRIDRARSWEPWLWRPG